MFLSTVTGQNFQLHYITLSDWREMEQRLRNNVGGNILRGKIHTAAATSVEHEVLAKVHAGATSIQRATRTLPTLAVAKIPFASGSWCIQVTRVLPTVVAARIKKRRLRSIQHNAALEIRMSTVCKIQFHPAVWPVQAGIKEQLRDERTT